MRQIYVAKPLKKVTKRDEKWRINSICGEFIIILSKEKFKVVNKKIPSYLLEKGQLIGTIIFTVLFAVVFLNIYTKSSTTAWFELDRSIYFFFTLGFISLDTLILVFSRIIMYKVKHHIKITYPIYFVWIIAEIFLIAIFYAYITSFFIVNDPSYFIKIFPKGLLCVCIILIVPYLISALYGAINAERETLSLQKYDDSSVTDVEGITKGIEIVHLSDNNGNLKLSLKLNNLLYIISQDNYINVYYTSDGELKNYMLRCKIKTVEESFAGSSLIRCHRSYIINADKIRVIRKEKDGTFIDLDYDGIKAIPVSKGYAAAISDLMSHPQS